MSDNRRKLSKRSGATEQRKILEEKLGERQEKDRQKTLAKVAKLHFLNLQITLTMKTLVSTLIN